MKTYSTAEVAEVLDISWDTLHRWMRENKFAVPPMRSVGKMKIRLWTKKDVKRVKKYKDEHYGEKPVRSKKQK
jgi:predicted site-specific integrase-resolvase